MCHSVVYRSEHNFLGVLSLPPFLDRVFLIVTAVMKLIPGWLVLLFLVIFLSLLSILVQGAGVTDAAHLVFYVGSGNQAQTS